VSQAERTAGVTRYRKIFAKNNNSSDIALESPRFFVDFLSTGGDYFRAAKAEEADDTQADAEDYDGGQTWTKGATTGTVEVGDSVTGVTSGATGEILAISSGSVRILVLTGTFQAEVVRKAAGHEFTTTGTGTYRDGYVGSGHLDSVATAGDSSIDVEFYASDMQGVLRVGDLIYITEKESIDDTGHDGEFLTIDTISWAGTVATIGTTTQLQYSYATSHLDGGGETVYTRVCGVLELDDLEGTVSNVVQSGLTGSIDDSQIVAHAFGAEDDSVTLTFTSSTAFSVTGTSVPSYGTGSISGDFAPTNPDTASPYFTIPSSAWSGPFNIGDVLTFDVESAGKGIWIKEVVPASTTSYSNNTHVFGLIGESA
jgi:hypothetical protein